MSNTVTPKSTTPKSTTTKSTIPQSDDAQVMPPPRVRGPFGPFDPITGRKPTSKTARAIDYFDTAEPRMTCAAVARLFQLDYTVLYRALRRREVLSAGQCHHCGHIPGTRIRQLAHATPPRPLG